MDIITPKRRILFLVLIILLAVSLIVALLIGYLFFNRITIYEYDKRNVLSQAQEHCFFDGSAFYINGITNMNTIKNGQNIKRTKRENNLTGFAITHNNKYMIRKRNLEIIPTEEKKGIACISGVDDFFVNDDIVVTVSYSDGIKLYSDDGTVISTVYDGKISYCSSFGEKGILFRTSDKLFMVYDAATSTSYELNVNNTNSGLVTDGYFVSDGRNIAFYDGFWTTDIIAVYNLKTETMNIIDSDSDGRYSVKAGIHNGILYYSVEAVDIGYGRTKQNEKCGIWSYDFETGCSQLCSKGTATEFVSDLKNVYYVTKMLQLRYIDCN